VRADDGGRLIERVHCDTVDTLVDTRIDPEIVAADVPADIQFQGTTEQTDQRKQLVNLYRCLLPVGTDVKSTDRVEWDGSDYEIDGETAIWRSPLAGVTDHVRIVLKEVLA